MSPALARKVREGFAILCWLYVLLKLFVLDIDAILVEFLFPTQTWVLRYRFILITLGLALFWLIRGTRRFSKNLLYILFYPFVVVFWRIPKFVYGRSTNVMFGIAISSILAIKSARKWFVIGTFSLTALLLIPLPSKLLRVITANLSTAQPEVTPYEHKGITFGKRPGSTFPEYGFNHVSFADYVVCVCVKNGISYLLNKVRIAF